MAKARTASKKWSLTLGDMSELTVKFFTNGVELQIAQTSYMAMFGCFGRGKISFIDSITDFFISIPKWNPLLYHLIEGVNTKQIIVFGVVDYVFFDPFEINFNFVVILRKRIFLLFFMAIFMILGKIHYC